MADYFSLDPNKIGGNEDANYVLKKKPKQENAIAEILSKASDQKITPKEVKKGAPAAIKTVATIKEKADVGEPITDDDLKDLEPEKDDDEPKKKIFMALAGALPTILGGAFGGAEGAAMGAKTTGDIFGNIQKQQEEARKKQQELDAKSSEAEKERELKRELQAEKNEALMAQLALTSGDRDLKSQLLQERLDKVKEGTDPQKSAALFARRLEQSEGIFKNLVKSGYNRASLSGAAGSSVPWDALKSGDALSQEQAERNFVNAVLRRESGAAISPTEFKSAEKQYFPRAGDTSKVLAQKAANRKQVVEGMKSAAGPALAGVPLVGIPDENAAPDFDNMSDEELKAYVGK